MTAAVERVTMADLKTKEESNIEVNGGSENETSNGKEAEIREKLYNTFNDALNKTKDEVKQLQEKLKEYDEKYQASAKVKEQAKKATDFLSSSLEEIKTTLDNLSTKAKDMFLNTKEVTNEAITNLWNSFNEAVDKLKKLTLDFDGKYKISENVTKMLAPIYARFKSLDNSLVQLRESMKGLGSNSRSYLINTAAGFETKYKIETKLSDLDQKYHIAERVESFKKTGEEFIEKRNLVEKAKELDERLTGSKAGAFIGQGVNLVKEELGKLQKEFVIAKENSSENLAAVAKEAE